MKRVGILVGREQSFPEALIESINERGKGETVAEFINVGGVRHAGQQRPRAAQNQRVAAKRHRATA